MENPTTFPQRVEPPGFGTEAPEPLEEVSIVITDFQFHTTTPRKPKTFADGVRKAVTTGNAGRSHHKKAIQITDPSTGKFEIAVPVAGLEELVAQFAAKGQRVRIFVPKAGIPFSLGKDATERLEALKRKGQLR